MPGAEDNDCQPSTSAVVFENQDSTEESEDEDKQQVTIQMPPTSYANISAQNSSNVHFGHTAVYNGDVTVIMSPAEVIDMYNNLHQLRQSGERVVSNGQPVDPTDENQTKLEEQEVQQCSDPPVVSADRTVERNSYFKNSIKRLLVPFLVSIGIVGLLICLAVILKTEDTDLCEDNNGHSECTTNGATMVTQGRDPLRTMGSHNIRSAVLSGPSGLVANGNELRNGTRINFISGTEGSARFYSREDWMAQPNFYTTAEHFYRPVEFVIISHSAFEPCFNDSQCIFEVQKIQRFHIDISRWPDIAYNFLVGGEGGIYEGRGWDTVGAHARRYNARSIGINLLGTFTNVLPTEAQMKSVKILIEEGVRLGKLREDYKLIGHRQVSVTDSPGRTFFVELQKWPHWYNFTDRPT